MKKVLIFASGNGSNFQAIVEYFKDKEVYFELLVNKNNCYALKRAQNLGVQSHYVPFSKTLEFLEKHNDFDLYVLAGYMRILPKEVLKIGEFINIHPSLLPKFKGAHAIKEAYNAREKTTGVSVHYVSEEVDGGEIIEQKTVQIKPGMTFEELEEQIHSVEHKIYPQVIEKLLNKKVMI